jgi:hypothetical protein
MLALQVKESQPPYYNSPMRDLKMATIKVPLRKIKRGRLSKPASLCFGVSIVEFEIISYELVSRNVK